MIKNILEYNNVEVKLDSDLKISDLSLTINQGEFIFLIGKTGSGKSSILKSMYSENKIIKGEAKISDTNLRTISEKEIPYLRRKIGIIFQDFQLLKDRTVYKNLEFVLNATGWSSKNKIKERINSCLEKVHISNLTDKYPSQLSGGQKQKVAIARSLLNEPEIIIADEPTGNLDPDTSHEIMDLLFEINKNDKTAFLMATHDYTLIERFPARVVQCADETVSENLDL